jgi:hypothetical protein
MCSYPGNNISGNNISYKMEANISYSEHHICASTAESGVEPKAKPFAIIYAGLADTGQLFCVLNLVAFESLDCIRPVQYSIRNYVSTMKINIGQLRNSYAILVGKKVK